MKVVYRVVPRVKIKNEKKTARRPPCSCGSWLAHWEKFSKQKAHKCSVYKCDEPATVATHITRPAAESDDYKTDAYLVPMCATHNAKHEEIFRSKNSVTFVWANVEETCGRELPD